MDALTTALELAGLASIIASAFLVAMPLGLAVLGLALVFLGLALGGSA